MRNLVFAVVLAGVTFVSTSFDNLLLLLGFFSHPSFRRGEVVRGYVGTVLLVALAAGLLGAAARFAPVRSLGWLGLVPIGLGIYHAARALSGRSPVGPPPVRPRAGHGGLGTTTLVTLASSADSFMVYTALFADTRSGLEPALLATIAVCAWGWTAVARGLLSHERLRGQVARVAPWALPLILIAVGVYILMDTPTDVVEEVEKLSRAAATFLPIA